MMSKWSEKVGELLDDIEKDNRIALRDQFAMAALTGMLAKDEYSPGDAGTAYDIADAMMEARK